MVGVCVGVSRCVEGVEGVTDVEGQEGDNKVGTNPACKFVNLFRLRSHVNGGLGGCWEDLRWVFCSLYCYIVPSASSVRRRIEGGGRQSIEECWEDLHWIFCSLRCYIGPSGVEGVDVLKGVGVLEVLKLLCVCVSSVSEVRHRPFFTARKDDTCALRLSNHAIQRHVHVQDKSERLLQRAASRTSVHLNDNDRQCMHDPCPASDALRSSCLVTQRTAASCI